MMNQPPKTKVFLEGRYRKLSRDLPQTVFFCPVCKGHPRRRRKCDRCEGFGKLTRDSVQELMGWVAGKTFGTRKNKFHGAGREDVDVRMLGQGRPFIMEMIGPKTFDVDLAALEAEINRRNEGRLEICGLHWSEKARVQIIKETHHAKEYGALLEVEKGHALDLLAVEALVGKRIDVLQGTPGRVAHRRADLNRERWIEIVSMARAGDDVEIPAVSEIPTGLRTRDGAGTVDGSVEGEDSADAGIRGELWQVVLRTQHGTYVKEVLSGEGGRTRPSLSSLLAVPCRCVALDVLDILGEGGEPLQAHAGPASFGTGLGAQKGDS